MRFPDNSNKHIYHLFELSYKVQLLEGGRCIFKMEFNLKFFVNFGRQLLMEIFIVMIAKTTR